jgi:hypothetical protein
MLVLFLGSYLAYLSCKCTTKILCISSESAVVFGHRLCAGVDMEFLVNTGCVSANVFDL